MLHSVFPRVGKRRVACSGNLLATLFYSTRAIDTFLGFVDFLEFLLGSPADVVAQRGYTVRVVLERHALIGAAHLVVRGIRCDAQHPVGILERGASEAHHLFGGAGIEVHVEAYPSQGR